MTEKAAMNEQTSPASPPIKKHRCMRCGEEFDCPHADTANCTALYDVLPSYRAPSGELIEHCPMQPDWAWIRSYVQRRINARSGSLAAEMRAKAALIRTGSYGNVRAIASLIVLWSEQLEEQATALSGSSAVAELEALRPSLLIPERQPEKVKPMERTCPECTRPVRDGVEHCPWCKHHTGKLIAPVQSAVAEPEPEKALARLTKELDAAKGDASHGWSEVDHQRAHKEEYIEMLAKADAALLTIRQERDKWLDLFNRSEQFQDGPTKRAEAAEATLASLLAGGYVQHLPTCDLVQCHCGTDEALAAGKTSWVRIDIVCPKHDRGVCTCGRDRLVPPAPDRGEAG